jgi:hypothetical protein
MKEARLNFDRFDRNDTSVTVKKFYENPIRYKFTPIKLIKPIKPIKVR